MGAIRTILITTLCIGLSGCYSMRGPLRPITRDGFPNQKLESHKVNISLFQNDFDLAYRQRGGKLRPGETIAPGDVPIKNMMKSGFLYNYTFCQDFFDEMGHNQRNSKVIRAALPSIVTLVTGVIGLQSFTDDPTGKEKLVQGLALASGAATAVLNIYDEHFLFGSENIQVVQTMTLKALQAHSNAVLMQQNITFEDGTKALIDNQDQCSPQAILALARTAMRDANLVGVNQSSQTAGAAPDNTKAGKVVVQVGK